MMELFHEDGHLTNQALEALCHNAPLDELQRLEIAEHLAFCDKCVAKYSAMLEDPLLLAPIQPAAPGVMQRLRERAGRLFVKRNAAVVAAASFAIVFWNIGVFNFDMTGSSRMLDWMTSSRVSFTEKTSEFADQVGKAFDQFFSNFTFERGTNDHEKK